MTEQQQHRATADHWALIERNHHHAEFSCILELLHRIEALEAAQHAHVDLSHLSNAERDEMLKLLANPGRFEALEVAADRAASEVFRAASTEPRPSEVAARIRAAADARAKSNHREIPDSSLMVRVANAMNGATEWQARQAIREVAVWLRKESEGNFGSGLYWAQELEQEAEQ